MAADDLADLIEQLSPRGAHVLRIGNTSAGAENVLRPILERLHAAQTAIPGDAFNVPLPQGVDLAIVALPVAATADVMEELLYARIGPALRAGGVALVQFCRDASDEALKTLRISSLARETLRSFLIENFGAKTIVSAAPVVNRFLNDGMFECLGWAPRTRNAARNEALVWLVLQKRAHGNTSRPAIVRSRRPDRYPVHELGPFLRALSGEGIQFAPVGDFAACTRVGNASGLVKLDLHRNIARAPEVGHALREAGILALFLMMHRHPFNTAFFDAVETWDILKRLRDDGHEVGLHLDPVALIRTHHDVYAGVKVALEDFAKHGFTIRAATLHGDTSAHIAARGLKAWDFFSEDRARSVWDGVPPQGDEFLADHVGRYSYAALYEMFGISDLVESHYRYRGERIFPDALLYLTDNSRSLQLTNIPGDGGTSAMTAAVPFRLPSDFAVEIAPILSGQRFLALFHPQWFW